MLTWEKGKNLLQATQSTKQIAITQTSGWNTNTKLQFVVPSLIRNYSHMEIIKYLDKFHMGYAWYSVGKCNHYTARVTLQNRKIISAILKLY
jgi:hypothetical protein